MTDATQPDFQQGVTLHRAGRFAEAQEIYEQVLANSPKHHAALHLLGVIFHQKGDHPRALEFIGRAIRLEPATGVYFGNYGAALLASGRLIEALACFHRAIQINPAYADGHANLGLALEKLGQVDLALESYEAALEQQPLHEDAALRLAGLLRGQGNARAAEKILENALSLQARPSFHLDLGNLLLSQSKSAQAAENYRAALALDPNCAAAQYNLGSALADQELTEEAAAAFAAAAGMPDAKPGWELRPLPLCPSFFDSDAVIGDYLQNLEGHLDHLIASPPQITLADLAGCSLFPPFGLSYLGRDCRKVKELYAGVFRHLFPPRTFSHAHRRPRIGFVVTERHQGVFLRCMTGIVRNLDPRFQPVLLCSRSIRQEIEAALGRQDLETFSFPSLIEEAQQVVEQAKCDLLYYWEAGSDAINYYLAMSRLAPVQCTSWGSQITTGIPNLDYFLSSELIESEGAQELYSETLWLAKTMPTFQQRLKLPGPVSRDHFGLPPEKRLYLCPQNLMKIHPDMDQVFAEILRRDPQGVIVLKQGRFEHTAIRLKERFARTMPGEASRVHFLPWLSLPDYYRLLPLGDVILDTIHFGAGSTAYDFFSFNLPVVTLPGRSIVSRVTSACLKQMQIAELEASSAADYVERAVQIASTPQLRSDLQRQLEGATPLLFEDMTAVKEHERFFADVLKNL